MHLEKLFDSIDIAYKYTILQSISQSISKFVYMCTLQCLSEIIFEIELSQDNDSTG